ncbi:tetratricopeptide repeat protein [Pleurocapsa sp. FMAR1]|uniref:tetratricopeptide repeat protein n=1 Tax=Pleurocapsa sp. FMAR1 TaxID=3040204 RepID=UPI0029C92C4D|nr:tetratricopeptide repeat protein [Pleurocapsa sp. FMAR1]
MKRDSKVAYKQGLIDAMKTDFDQYNLFQSSKRELSDSFEIESALILSSASSILKDSNIEEQLRISVKEKAFQGDYTAAITLLDRLIALCPDNATDYNNRGLMHFRNNQIIEALCDLSQALEINPYLDSAYNNRANCYAAQGALTEAIADYDIALDLNPGNFRAWINQGIAFRELEMYDLAIENFGIAQIIGDTLQERIYLERGRTYHLRGDWNCAVGDYQNALRVLEQKPELARHRRKVLGWLDELLSPLFINYRSRSFFNQ